MLRVTLISFSCLLASAVPVLGQRGAMTQLAVPNSPAYEEAASRLRQAPTRNYSFSGAYLADVMRLMAEEAGISFFGLPDGSNGADRLVTFSIEACPFTALETLAKANGISLIFERGIWYLRPADDKELVGRIYHINYNAQELVKKNDQVGALGGSSIGTGAGGASSIGLNLQGSPDFFVTEPSRLLEDIEAILDLRTTGRNAIMAPAGSVDTLGQVSIGGLPGQPDVVARADGASEGEGGESDSDQAKVIWNSDSNSLYVVATRQQHQWVEGYLAAADRPQPLVAVEVKIIEINKDPQRELGIDWTGTLSGGWGARVTGVNDSISGPIDLNNIGAYSLPTAILSYDEVNLRLRALFDDRKNRAVSYPRMITMDNREVSFRSVINQPVLSSSASTSLGAGATETNSVEYVPIGTVINILPKRMADGKVLLNVSLTVSDIVGTEVINGNPFPIATSRVYTAPITVESGYTVAISGLDAAEDDRAVQGVPILGRIPILGYAFKFRGDASSRQHLMMLITPTLLEPTDPGVPERPTIRNPWGDKLPPYQPFSDDKEPIEDKRLWKQFNDRDNYYEDTVPPPHEPHYGPHTEPEMPPQYPPHQVAEVAPNGGTEPAPVMPTGQERHLENVGEPMPVVVEASPVTEKKGPLAKLFGKRKKLRGIITGPADEVGESSPLLSTEASMASATAELESVDGAPFSPDETERKKGGDPRGFLAWRKKKPEAEVAEITVTEIAPVESLPAPNAGLPEEIARPEEGSLTLVAAAPKPTSAPQQSEEGVGPEEASSATRPAEEAVAPIREASVEPTAVEATRKGTLRWDGPRLIGGTEAVPSAVKGLEASYQAAEDGSEVDVLALGAQANRLLDYVNLLRDEGEISLNGKLSDEWWSLLKLKSQFQDLSRIQATSVVETIGATEQP